MKFTAKLLRLYFNQGVSSSDKQWSVDQGEGTVELLAQFVAIKECNAVTRIAPDKAVSAWLEFVNVHVLVIDNPASLRISSDDTYFD